MTIEIITPVGRMVQGHPMRLQLQKDKQGNPKKTKAGEDFYQAYVGLAIPKGTEQHWSQTEWGAQIYNAGVAAFPNGEHGAPTFAWKITDGDSAIPNKKGIAPNTREGFPGHWVIGASSGFAADCFADGNYGVKVMREDRFKTGDYVRLCLTVTGNKSADSPGVYVNLQGCELIQAGPEIVSAGAFDAQGTFGAAAPVATGTLLQDPNIANPQMPAAQGYAPQAAPANGYVAVGGATPLGTMANAATAGQNPVVGNPLAQGYAPPPQQGMPPVQQGMQQQPPVQQGMQQQPPVQQGMQQQPPVQQAHNFLPQG